MPRQLIIDQTIDLAGALYGAGFPLVPVTEDVLNEQIAEAFEQLGVVVSWDEA